MIITKCACGHAKTDHTGESFTTNGRRSCGVLGCKCDIFLFSESETFGSPEGGRIEDLYYYPFACALHAVVRKPGERPFHILLASEKTDFLAKAKALHDIVKGI